jgi:hypothetical protein
MTKARDVMNHAMKEAENPCFFNPNTIKHALDDYYKAVEANAISFNYKCR